MNVSPPSVAMPTLKTIYSTTTGQFGVKLSKTL
ncbi:hypothetical protein T11_7189 [Trichinella zimbabwensis]|uniref:Uncharacterized protein n=1 Tax=Trichinella zimbabwensis TaxID=268475 RepID=A0A0V1DSP8_9BILA|nr:hypothetical protein T11_7189 [Trichinella zimbabwensis]